MRRAGLALAGALALAACGSGNQWGGAQGGSAGEGGNGGGGNGGAPCPDGVTLRVVGMDPGMVTSLSLALGGITAAYDGGATVAVTALPGPVDVGASADDVAVLHLASLTGDLGHPRVTLTFSGGSAFLGGAGGTLDLCTGPLSFPLDPLLVKHDTCDVVLRLDVARSVGTSAGGLWFLPQFRVTYH